MMDIALALGGETDMDAMLELVVKRARALVSAGAMAVALLEGAELVVAATAGELPPHVRGQRLPLADTAADLAIRERRAQHMSTDAVREVLHRLGEESGALRGQAGLVVPLVFRDHPLGVLVALDRLAGEPRFGERDEQLLQAFATSAAAALATARTVATDLLQSRLTAAEAERKRWARELHDETLQALAMLRMTLAAGRRKTDIAAVHGAVSTALEHIDAQISSLRGLIAEVRPTALDDLGFGAALEAFVERAATLGGRIELDLDLEPEGGGAGHRHEPELEAALYRIAQEAITNAVKHAAATRVRVTVREVDDVIAIRVEDDGAGFDVESATTGFGLTGMRERVELAGGALHVTSSPGHGTVVVARVPARRRPGDRAPGGDRTPSATTRLD
jgi:signal transduction histidine kinase